MTFNLLLKNNFNNFSPRKKKLKSLNKSFEKVFQNLKKEINDSKKTINILSENFLNLNLLNLRKFKKFKTVAVIGMGGSILGAEAISSFLAKKIKKKIYYFDDIDENKIFQFRYKENLKKTLFIIISKSGNTIETITNAFSLNILKKNAKNVIIITERKNNLLFNLSRKLKLFFVEHNQNIGGRYSVLSEVGIIPAYLMGINIAKLRSNLQIFFNKNNKSLLKSSTTVLSNFLVTKKYSNLIFLNYSPNLEKFLYWCQQLIAESLGKNKKGFLPVISNVPKDHHSLLQLYLDGPNDKMFYIFSSKEASKLKIDYKSYFNKNNFSHKKTLGQVKIAQKNALIKSLKKKKIPYREIEIKKIDEENLSKLFTYFILETIIIGKLSKINPFNQPAVEQVKIYTKKLLK